MEKVYLSLGSNLGDRLDYLSRAVMELKKIEETEIFKSSSVFETEPFGFTEQPYFYNIALEINTGLSPEDLLNECKKIEENLGRSPRGKWREREIDIDILFFGRRIIDTINLVIPHKELSLRRFVLEPLNEIAGEFKCPRSHKSINELLEICTDKSNVINIHKIIPGVS